MNPTLLTASLLKYAGRFDAPLKFLRRLELMHPGKLNAARILAGAGAGYAVSDPLSDATTRYTLPAGESLTPVDRATEKIINMLVGGSLAAKGGVVGNPHLGRTLASKALLLQAPTGVHYGMNFLRSSSDSAKNLAQASNELNTNLPGTDKPALRVAIESLGGTGQQVNSMMDRAPAAADRLEKIPVNAASQILERFGQGLSPVLGGVTGATIGNLIGNAVADKERTPDDIRRNDRRRALLTLGLGGAGAGVGWLASHPAEFNAGTDKLQTLLQHWKAP